MVLQGRIEFQTREKRRQRRREIASSFKRQRETSSARESAIAANAVRTAKLLCNVEAAPGVS
jgi:hypothetical protein